MLLEKFYLRNIWFLLQYDEWSISDLRLFLKQDIFNCLNENLVLILFDLVTKKATIGCHSSPDLPKLMFVVRTSVLSFLQIVHMFCPACVISSGCSTAYYCIICYMFCLKYLLLMTSNIYPVLQVNRVWSLSKVHKLKII